MVENPRTATSAHGLRPLSEPRPVEVRVEATGGGRSKPVAVLHGQQWLRVEQIEEEWHVAEGWWRDEAIARTYFQMTVQHGLRLTLFHDDTEAQDSDWYEQRY